MVWSSRLSWPDIWISSKFTNLSKGNKRKQIFSFDSSFNRKQVDQKPGFKTTEPKLENSVNKSNPNQISTSDSVLNGNHKPETDQNAVENKVYFLFQPSLVEINLFTFLLNSLRCRRMQANVNLSI